MKAMIFAAGLGTRLRPYTNDRPKALAEVGGMPLLEIQLRRLQRYGFREVVVNVHHYADMVEDFLKKFDRRGMAVHVSDERDLLLDTGGGLLHARHFLEGNEAIYLCNVDVITDLDPRVLLEAQAKSGALATLGLLRRETSRVLTFNGQMQLTGWRNLSSGDQKGNPAAGDTHWAFCGLHVTHPELLRKTARTGVFSVIDLYLDHADTGRIRGLDLQGTLWMDVGKPAELERAAELLPRIL